MSGDHRIDAIDLRIVALPMVEPFVASHGTVSTRTAVLVRLVTADGEGWGDCAALPEPTYTDEFVDGAFVALQEILAPRLLGAERVSADSLAAVFDDVTGHPMARAAIELALLDLEGRADGSPLARRLAPHPPGPSPTVPAGVAIGLVETPGRLAALVRTRVDEGYRRIKLKIAPGNDIEFVRAARDAAGADVVLMADANGAYSIDDSHTLARLDEFHLACLEQPLAADELLDSAELARRLATPIALDESLTSTARTDEALDMGACSVVCVKAPRYGSWLAAAAVLDRCANLGIDAYVGGMLDTGLGRAANLALAAHPGASLPGDLAATTRFFSDDVCAPIVLAGDSIDVPGHPGLGIVIDADALERLTVRRVTIPRP